MYVDQATNQTSETYSPRHISQVREREYTSVSLFGDYRDGYILVECRLSGVQICEVYFLLTAYEHRLNKRTRGNGEK